MTIYRHGRDCQLGLTAKERRQRDERIRQIMFVEGCTTRRALWRLATDKLHIKISESRIGELLNKWESENRAWRFGLAKMGWESHQHDTYRMLGEVRARLEAVIQDENTKPAAIAMCSNSLVAVIAAMKEIALDGVVPEGITDIIQHYEERLAKYEKPITD